MKYTFDDITLSDPTRTYRVVCNFWFDDDKTANAELLEVYLYARPEPLVSDKPGKVNLIAGPGEPDILSLDELDRLTTYAEGHAPEPEEERTMPDKDDDLTRRIFDPILESIQRSVRPAEIAGRRDD